MDQLVAKDAAWVITTIEQSYVQKMDQKEGGYLLLDEMLNPISRIYFFPDGIMVTDEDYGMAPMDLQVNGEIRELIANRLEIKSQEDLPKIEDYFPF